MVVDCNKNGLNAYSRPYVPATVVYRLFYGDQVYVHPFAMALFLKSTLSSPAGDKSSRSALRQQEEEELEQSQYFSALGSPLRETPHGFPSLIVVKILHPQLGYTTLYSSGQRCLLPLCHLPSALIPSSVSLFPPSDSEFGPPNVPRRCLG